MLGNKGLHVSMGIPKFNSLVHIQSVSVNSLLLCVWVKKSFLEAESKAGFIFTSLRVQLFLRNV